MDSAKKRGNASIMCMSMALIFLPRLLKALLMRAKGTGLASWQVTCCSFAGYLVAAVLVYLAVCGQKEKKSSLAHMGKTILVGGFWMLAAYMLTNFLSGLPFFTAWEQSHSNPVVGNLPGVIAILIQGICLGIFLMLFLVQAADLPEQMSFGKKFLISLKNVIPVIVFAVDYFVVRIVYGILLSLFIQGFGKNVSVISYLSKVLILAFLVSLAVSPVILWMLRKAEQTVVGAAETAVKGAAEVSEKRAEEKAPEVAGGVAAGTAAEPQRAVKTNAAGTVAIAVIPLVVMVVVAVADKVTAPSQAEYALGSIIAYVQSAEERQSYDDYVGVARDLEQMDVTISAWKNYFSENTNTLRDLSNANPDNYQILLLHVNAQLEKEGTVADASLKQRLEQVLLQDPDNAVWHFMYLDYASRAKKQSESNDAQAEDKDKDFKADLISRLIAADIYTNTAMQPSAISAKDKEWLLEHLSEERLEVVRENFLVSLMRNDLLNAGGSYKNLIDDWFKIAKEHPDNFGIQKFVLDGVRVYRVSELYDAQFIEQDRIKPDIWACVQRYDKAFVEGVARREDLSEDERNGCLIDEKYEMASLLYDCEMLEETQTFLTEAVAQVDSEILSDFLMVVALYNKDYVAVQPILEENITNYPENSLFVSMAAIMNYRQGNVDQALEYTVKLAELAASPESDAASGAELLAMVDTFVCDDHSMATGNRGKANSFGSFSEEQMAVVQRSELLTALLECENYYRLWIYQGQHAGVDRYSEIEERLEKIVEKYPDVSATYYLLGNLYGNYSDSGVKSSGCMDLERAEELYRKCLEIDEEQPAVWYALACLYDHTERYEESYECVKEAVDRLNAGVYTGYGGEYHGYGIKEHALLLMHKLERELKKN